MGMKMTFYQKFLKMAYPAFIFYEKIKGKRKIIINDKKIVPGISVYSLEVELSGGPVVELEKFRGKKILVVNTASNCGYTAQFDELQRLYQHSREDLEIIAFPSNDFGEQEKNPDEMVREFCINVFSVRFMIAKKTVVKKTSGQNKLYEWLTKKELNGWNDKAPVWNFSKYLITEEGILTHYFDPAVSPVSEEMIRAVHS